MKAEKASVAIALSDHDNRRRINNNRMNACNKWRNAKRTFLDSVSDYIYVRFNNKSTANCVFLLFILGWTTTTNNNNINNNSGEGNLKSDPMLGVILGDLQRLVKSGRIAATQHYFQLSRCCCSDYIQYDLNTKLHQACRSFKYSSENQCVFNDVYVKYDATTFEAAFWYLIA